MDDTTRSNDRSARTARGSSLLAEPVDGALVARYRRRSYLALVLMVVAIAGAVIAMVVAVGETSPDRDVKDDPPAMILLFTAALLAALELAMYAYRVRRIARVLDGRSWQPSSHEVVVIGSGKRAQPRLHLTEVDRWFRPTYYLASTTKLERADALDWAGDLDGHVVVRLPERGRLHLYYAVPG